MSRIGKLPVKLPETVKAVFSDGKIVISGPKGELSQDVRSEIEIQIKDGEVNVLRKKDDKFSRALHGLYRSLITNMVEGVLNGFEKTLKLIGVGYRVREEKDKLVLSVGFSHDVDVMFEKGLTLKADGNDIIKISGIDKARVGEKAATIRRIRPPEPYKGKGIRYIDEIIRLKAGKAGKTGAEAGA
ncbi:MAG: 50S ribosomal protein L6 [Patescibacteria group bacterium]|nr:50S ribosomal protein L6 [Patescibacteria group bacterium]